jgi:SAM-dependent methyltransferase
MSAETERHCNVCGSSLGQPLYRSPGAESLTSLCEVWRGETTVFLCEDCGHLQTDELPDIDAYYDHEYNILVESVDEDQIYRVVDGKPVYRTDHQVATLVRKVPLGHGALVLDYGCAKGATLRKLVAMRPDIVPHLFDVSSNYVRFWREFALPENWATYEAPAGWAGQFDLVTSFYALEHMADPASALRTIRSLLRPGGVFYGVVPNVFTNTADFIVADHVNHFTDGSLARLFRETGFVATDIDSTSHDGAFVFSATVSAQSRSTKWPDELTPRADVAKRLADYWSGIATRVRAFESENGESARAAIYGSGFYGSFIVTCLRHPDRVECFVDRNPHQQRKQLFEKPIIAPSDLSKEIGIVYVGLNPRIAHQSIDEIRAWAGRDHRYFFL